MKKNMILVLAAMSLLASCEVKQTEKNSTGKVLEVLVAANHGALSQTTNALIDSIFSQPQRCLPQMEPRFNAVKVPLDRFSKENVYQAYRCIVKCTLGKDNANKVFIDRDKWAKPQVYVLVSATCEDSLCALLRRYESQIVNAFYDTEHQRFINLFSGSGGNGAIVSKVQKKFGFSVAVGRNYSLLKENDNFIWAQEKLIEKSDKLVLSNLLIQTTPYESQEQFSQQQLLDRLDTMLCRNMEARNGGYAGIERDTTLCEVLTSYVDYPGAKYAIQTRGLWGLRETNNRMGGPLVAYSILSPDGQTIVDILGLVYAPKLEKRDFLLKLESMGSSVRW